MIGQLDAMFINVTEWRITKHALHILDVMAVQLSDRYADIAGMFITSNLFWFQYS